MNSNELTDQVLTLNELVWQPFAMPTVLVIVGGLITLLTCLLYTSDAADE